MKKITALVLAMILFVCANPAFAAGKITVTQENFHIIDSYSLYTYAYAKVENTGNKPMMVNAGLLEVYNADGDTITSNDYLNTYAKYLEPGEYTYCSLSAKVEDDSTVADIDDYLLTISGKSDNSYVTKRFPVVTDYQKDVAVSKYSKYDYMYATVTNDTDETVYGVSVILVLLDDDENILYMESDSLYDKGILPGGSVVIRADVSSTSIEAYEKAGFEATHCDAIAYTYIDIDD